MWLSHTIGNCNSHNGFTKNQQKRMPLETEKLSLMMIGGKQIGGQRLGGRNYDGSGTTKSEDFFCLRTSHPRSGNHSVCDGERTHTPCRTHILLALCPCVAHRHRAHAWLKAFAVRMSHLTISLFISHVSSTVLAVPARSPRPFVPVCTFLAELFPIRKRGSSALLHERRGVWLPGRPHAFHNLAIDEIIATAAFWRLPSPRHKTSHCDVSTHEE